MPKDAKFNSDIHIQISGASNGFTVEGHTGMMDNQVKYVYKDMDEVMDNLKAIYSVLDAKKKPETEKSLKRAKESINKGNA